MLLSLLLLLRGGVLPAGPAFVYGCYWGAVPAYILAELLGGVAAALVSWPLYGTGLQLGRCAGLQWLLQGDAATSYALLGGRPAVRLPTATALCPRRPHTCLRCTMLGSILQHIAFST